MDQRRGSPAPAGPGVPGVPAGQAEAVGARGARLGGFLLISLFFLSGSAGLMYEVVWNRLLGLQMGNTAYALATILTVFMGGLALGSYVGGRFTSRIRNAVLVYGVLEVAIGLYCLALPFVIEALRPVMAAAYNQLYESFALFSLAQFFICGAALILPVTLMGATLPIVAEHLTRSRDAVSTMVGAVYAMNTIGAFVGCMVAGMWLIPRLGVSATNSIAAAVSLTAGVGGIAASRLTAPTRHLIEIEGAAASAPAPKVEAKGGGARRKGAAAHAAEARDASDGIPVWLLLLGFGASGFAAMSHQVSWTRFFTLCIGSATYAFTLIVGAFILGLAAGAAVIGRLGDRARLTTPLLVASQFALGAVAVGMIALLGDLPVRFTMVIAEHASDYDRLLTLEFMVIFGVVVVPTFIMGGMLPLVCKDIARRRSVNVGAVLGRAYASNTIGTILGSFTAGFVLLPWLGMQTTIAVGAIVNALVGAAFLTTAPGAFGQVRSAAASLAAIGIALGAVGIPRWNHAVVTSAPYVHAKALAEYGAGTMAGVRKYLDEYYKIVHYDEGVSTTVTVSQDTKTGAKILHVGGKREAGGFDASQAYLAHLPLALADHPEEALVIGLGAGGTLASAQAHPTLKRIDCVEISEGVRDAAVEHFDRGPNLADPRLRMIIGDGRLHIALTDQKYDVVISQPSNPWMVGASALFTREAFEEMRSLLKPGGVACVWVQGFSVTSKTVDTLVNTFREVFPEMDLWESRVLGDYFLTGYLEPMRIDPARIAQRMKPAGVAAELTRMRIESAADFLGYYIASAEGAALLPDATEVNTDDLNVLEARIPRNLLDNPVVAVAEHLLPIRRSVAGRVSFSANGIAQQTFMAEADKIFQSKPVALAYSRIEKNRERSAEDMRRLGELAARLQELNPADPRLDRVQAPAPMR